MSHPYLRTFGENQLNQATVSLEAVAVEILCEDIKKAIKKRRKSPKSQKTTRATKTQFDNKSLHDTYSIREASMRLIDSRFNGQNFPTFLMIPSASPDYYSNQSQ